MSMDLQNQNADGMSMGQLSSAKDGLNGMIADATKQLNGGQAPNMSGGGDYGGMGLEAAPVSKFAGGNPDSKIGFPDTQTQVTSMYHEQNHKAPVDPLFGQKYTRKQFKEMIKQEAATLSHIAKKGYMAPQKRSEETFRHADSVFEGANRSAQTISPIAYAMSMKFLKLTPEMMINLGIIPKAIKDNLDQAHVKLEKPEAKQIVNSAKNSENETAQRMFDNSSASSKEVVAAALDTKKKDGGKAFKPPSMKDPSKPEHH